MLSITTAEFKNNFRKYALLGQKEEIEVTINGEVVFYITPKRVKTINQVEKMFGSLPKDAYCDNDINRE